MAAPAAHRASSAAWGLLPGLLVAAGVYGAGEGPTDEQVDAAVTRGVKVILECQEGAEWPYEGVYRTNEGGRRAVIPIGYRVGGTAIASLALIEAPGFATNAGAIAWAMRARVAPAR